MEQQTNPDEIMQQIATALTYVLKKNLGKNIGFVLITFDFKNAGITNYISNAKQEDVVKGLRESADIIESGNYIPTTQGSMQ